MGLMAVANISFAILNLASCRPVQKIWLHSTSGTCWSEASQESVALYNGSEYTGYRRVY